MPRDLADVLHYFLPELDEASEPATASPAAGGVGADARDGAAEAGSAPETMADAALPILGVPIGDREVVRAALTWNLAVEIARLGQRAVILAPSGPVATPLWPEAGTGPMGTELRFCSVTNLVELALAAHALAAECASEDRSRRGVVFVRVPPQWLDPALGSQASKPDRSIDWWLLMSSPNQRDLAEAVQVAASIARVAPGARTGVTIHGVSSVAEARRAYEHWSRSCTQRALEVRSYGLLVDDLHVYRAIAAQRPIGLEHPQAPATRALMDVARLLVEDAPEAVRRG